MLHAEQLVVSRDGRIIFAGPGLAGEPLETVVARTFPGGRLTVRKYELSASSDPLEITLIAAGVGVLVIMSVLAIATLLARTIQAPIQRAIAAADTVAAGDFSARMGGGGPEEFDRLSRAFDDMAERLEASDIEQRRFLADIAHEIATPVNAISNLAGALADGIATNESDRAEARGLLAGETARVQALLGDLRQLTSLDIAVPVRVENVDLHRLCVSLASRFTPAASAAGLRLEARAEALSISSNERLLDTVLSNLLTNAIRYTPPGGSITLQAQSRRGRPTVSVTDTGIGIAPEHRSRIFDRLYRVDTDRGRSTGGSGLGLAIVRRGAHALGATIKLDSEPGNGSTFTLHFPTSRTRASHITPDETSGSTPASPSGEPSEPAAARFQR